METAPAELHSWPRLWPQLLPVLWLPPLLALLVFGATRDGSFLSDDYLLGAYLDSGSETIAVRWRSIFADFTRPWLGLDSSFYRPMLSVSFGLDLQRGGADPAVFHTTNLALHLITTFNTAWLCALCCPQRPRLAALLGGCLFAVHPIACEPIAWIAARNSGLEVFFRTFALVAFASNLRAPSRARFCSAGMFIACALGSKESSIILPVSLLGLDLLLCPNRSWRERLGRHLRFAPFWLGYFALRYLLFGQLVGSTGAVVSGADMVDGFTSKAGALFVPNGPSLPIGWSIVALGLFYGLAVLGGIRDRALRPTLLLGTVWLLCHFAPTYQLRVFPDLAGSRMLYGTVTILAIVLARLSLGSSLRLARIGFGAGIASVIALGLLAHRHVGHYREVWHEVDLARAQLDRIGQELEPGQSLAITSMPKNRFGIPVLNENAFFPLAEKPFASADYPVAGLGFVTLPVPRSEDLFQDPAPFRALWAEGSPLLQWQPPSAAPDALQFRVRRRPAETAIPALIKVPDRPSTFAFERPCSAYWFEGVEITVSGSPGGGKLWWQTAATTVPEDLRHVAFGAGEVADGKTTFRIDLSHAFGLLAFTETRVDIVDLAVEFDGRGSDSLGDLTMVVIARVPELELAVRFDGAVLSVADFERRVVVPAGATRLVLIGPHSGFSVPVTAGSKLVIPTPVRAEIEGIARISRVNQYRFYFEARGVRGKSFGARSKTDGFRVAR